MQFVSTAEIGQCHILHEFLQANKTVIYFCFCCHDEPDNCVSGMGQEPENLAFIQKGPPYVYIYMRYVLQNSNYSPYYLLVTISRLATTKTPVVL